MSVFITIPKKGNTKECPNYHTIAHISHTSKIMLKILKARLQQYVNHELPDVQAEFRKGRGTRDQIANICWIITKARLPVHHQLPESTQTHIHRVGDAIQPSHPLSSPSPPAPNPSQHQSLFQ